MGIKEEMVKLKIIKHNLSFVKYDYNLKDKFIVEEDENENYCYYDITQNLQSLPLIFSSANYPDVKTCFFVELINFFQSIPIQTTYPYRSYSQSLTTYCLKQLNRSQLIKIVFSEPEEKRDLDDYAQPLGNFNLKSEVSMTEAYFYKLRSLDKRDLSLIENIAKILDIDLSNLEVCYVNEKVHLKLNKKFLMHQILSGETFKNIWCQKENIYFILEGYFDYIFSKDYKKKRS